MIEIGFFFFLNFSFSLSQMKWLAKQGLDSDIFFRHYIVQVYLMMTSFFHFWLAIDLVIYWSRFQHLIQIFFLAIFRLCNNPIYNWTMEKNLLFDYIIHIVHVVFGYTFHSCDDLFFFSFVASKLFLALIFIFIFLNHHFHF